MGRVRAGQTRETVANVQIQLPSQHQHSKHGTAQDDNEALSESRDIRKTSEASVDGADHGSNGRKRKRRTTDGLGATPRENRTTNSSKWPPAYAPKNPDDVHIIAGMNRVNNMYQDAGLDKHAWEEDSPMRQAMGENQKLTQRMFKTQKKRLKIYAEVEKHIKKHKLASTTNASNVVENNTHYEPRAPATACSSPSEDNLNEPSSGGNHLVPNNDNPGFDSLESDVPISPVSVRSDANFLDPPVEPVSDTISRLQKNAMLKSIDIYRCVGKCNMPPTWRVFEPGYPFNDTVLKHLSNSANNLVFFLNENCHWSLARLDMEQGHLNHYNSSKSIDMRTSDLIAWVLKQAVIKVTSGITIQQKVCSYGFLYLNGSNPRQECPQQEDGFNCGIFALAFLESLLNGDDIPSQVDTVALRNTFALRLRDTAPPEPASPLDGKLYPRPSSHLDQPTLPDCRTSPDPSEHDNTKPPTLDTKTCVQQLLESFRRDKNGLEEKAKKLVVEQEALSCMQQDLDSLQQEFEKDEENVRDLQKQVKFCQMYLDWFKNCPDGNDFHNNQYLNKLKSDLESTNESTMEERHSLSEKLGSAQAKCGDGRKSIRQLQAKIDSHKTRQDSLEDSIAKAERTLADVKQMCAQIVEG
ncbi:hypothetical protein FSARC_7645 [Fusarium sarcochroum]|uniref:Ubiquitin-like protease family profile domain-containing protein n=1 Tax=Fusarium sarcochroum TaxID=1208366 RepID=A0A8H4TUN9_9HYPO|nr:hypothetical protein FSARC_7645 [Fusarium sarcochroum]